MRWPRQFLPRYLQLARTSTAGCGPSRIWAIRAGSTRTTGEPNGALLIDNTQVGDATYDYGTTAEQCKDGGYANFTEPSFDNQGQCVAYANHHDDNGQDGAHGHSDS